MSAMRLALLTIVCASCLSACAPEVAVRPLTPEQMQRVHDATRAIVLLQIETTIDGKSIAPTSMADSNRSLRLYAARMDTGETPGRVLPAALSERSAASGWRYLLLEPGRYFLLILPPGVEQNPPAVAYHAPSGKFGRLTRYRFEAGRGGFWIPDLMAFVLSGAAPDDFRALPGFWFEVPADRSVLYAGSLRIACTDCRGLGGLIDSCSDFERRDDIVEAQRVVGEVLPGESLHAAPLIVYGQPRHSLDAHDIGAMSITLSKWDALGVVYPEARLAPWGLVTGTERPVLVFNLLAIAARAIGQAAAGKDSVRLAEAARACMQNLSSGLANLDSATPFRQALRTALGRDLSTTVPERGELYVTPTLLRLRQSANNDHLALELGLHVRLQAGLPANIVYESRLTYAEPFHRENPLERSTRLYERRTAQTPTPYPLAHWCGSEGPMLLEAEINRGLTAIAAQIARDFGN